MLGFAIAAMVPPRVRAPITADVPGRGADDDSRGEPRASSPLPVLPSRGPDPERGAVDIVTIGSSGSGGNAGGFGGVLLTRWRVASTVMFCFGGGGRTGEISELRSSATVILAKAGVSWQPFRTNGERFFALGLRADLLASLQLVSRTLAFDQTSRGSRWMPGADLLVEGGWYFHPRLAAVAAFGGEVAFGTTRVYIGDVQRATIPKLRMVGELGVRVRF